MSFSKGGDKPQVPVNPMGQRYMEIHQKANPETGPRSRGSRAKAQLRLAEKTETDVSALARDFQESVDKLEREYVPRKEPFHPPRPGEAAWQAKYIDEYVPKRVVTSNIAARAQESGLILEGEGEIGYVDREIKPVRTTKGTKPKKGSGIDLRLDLLLAQGDRPIVAEVKCRGDENAYYALIQSLAAAAQLSPKLQRKRLTWAYGEGRDENENTVELSETKAIAVWLILSRHNSRGEEKRQMFELTRRISRKLMRNKDFRRYVSEIRCVWAADLEDEPVRLAEEPFEFKGEIDDRLRGWCAK